MRQMGLQGVVRGKSVRTTVSDAGGAVPARPGEPAVPRAAAERAVGRDFTYVATWSGFVYVAFVIDAYRPPDRGLAGVAPARAELRARCAGAGPARAAPGAGRQPRPPQRSRRSRRIQAVVATPWK